jgi:hypothetical protein
MTPSLRVFWVFAVFMVSYERPLGIHHQQAVDVFATIIGGRLDRFYGP